MVSAGGRPFEAVLFDLDGTLTDPRVGIIRCIQHALNAFDRTAPDESELLQCIGPPLRASFSHLLGTQDPALVERALSTYRERFATTGLYENALYPSIVEMLEGSRRLATRIFVVTSKPAIYANRIIQHFRLEGYFSGVYGPDLDGRLDDKRDLLAHVLESARITGASVMVGDRAVDILAARANAVHAIGALWGYGSAPELVEAGADRLCPHPLALEGCLEELASQ